jgi:predicted ArsR family transcriptional regulator
MSRKNLENSDESIPKTAERLLHIVKTTGPRTTTELSTELGITKEAARLQLAKLAADGVLEATFAASPGERCAGRPSQRWRLTESGHRRFPDAHAELTVQLLQTIRTELGVEALDRLISAREQETRANYRRELESVVGWRARAEALAAIRTREGYMAECIPEGEGLLLIENHCPICAAATACQNFCRAELAVFQEVLGDAATVTRVEHIPSGARRCAYRIEAVGSRESTDH